MSIEFHTEENNMKYATAALLWIALSCLLAMGAGCEAWDRLVDRDSGGSSSLASSKKAKDLATVEVKDADGDVEVVTVMPSGNKNSKKGVGHLRAREWDQAIDAFKAALPKKESKDAANDYYALGIAYEVKEDVKLAVENHKCAVRLKNDDKFSQALMRAEAKLKKLAGVPTP